MTVSVLVFSQVLFLPMLEYVGRQVRQMEVLKKPCLMTSLMFSAWPTAQCW